MGLIAEVVSCCVPLKFGDKLLPQLLWKGKINLKFIVAYYNSNQQ